MGMGRSSLFSPGARPEVGLGDAFAEIREDTPRSDLKASMDFHPPKEV